MDKNSEDSVIRTAEAIRKHMTATENGITFIRYHHYDHVPMLAVSPAYIEKARTFLDLYERRDEFQNAIGLFEPDKLATMKYLYLLSDWGQESIERDQRLTRAHEQGMGVDLDEMLPGIKRREELSNAALEFMKPVSRLYEANHKINSNRFNFARTDEERQEDINGSEDTSIFATLTFVGLHKDPNLVSAQIEITEKLGELAQDFYAIAGKAEKHGSVGHSWMSVGEGHTTAYRLDDGTYLPQIFDDLMAVSGLGRSCDDILIEPAPAQKYLSGMIMEAFQASRSGDSEAATNKFNEYQQERDSILGDRKMPEYQPKGHQKDEDPSVSLARRKTEVLEIIESMKNTLHDFDVKLDKQIEGDSKFAKKATESKSAGGGLMRGGESTPPKPKDGGWTDNT